MKIIFLNTYYKNCGVYQYGLRLSKCLESMVEYKEVNDYNDYVRIIHESSPDVIIFNYHIIFIINQLIFLKKVSQMINLIRYIYLF